MSRCCSASRCSRAACGAGRSRRVGGRCGAARHGGVRVAVTTPEARARAARSRSCQGGGQAQGAARASPGGHGLRGNAVDVARSVGTRRRSPLRCRTTASALEPAARRRGPRSRVASAAGRRSRDSAAARAATHAKEHLSRAVVRAGAVPRPARSAGARAWAAAGRRCAASPAGAAHDAGRRVDSPHPLAALVPATLLAAAAAHDFGARLRQTAVRADRRAGFGLTRSTTWRGGARDAVVSSAARPPVPTRSR